MRGRMVWGFQVGGASRAPCLAIVYMPIWVLLGAPLGRIIHSFCGCYWAIGAGCGAGLSCVPGAATMAPRGLLSMPVPWGCAVLGGCWRGVVSYCVLCSLCCLCERLLTVCTLCSYCVALRRLLSVAAIVSCCFWCFLPGATLCLSTRCRRHTHQLLLVVLLLF